MSFILNTTTKRLYGRDYKINVVAEDRSTKQRCYEIYDSDGDYIGSAGTTDEIYDVVRNNN